MTTADIERLIAKYLDGQTTPEEEKRLALALNRQDIPVRWQAIAQMLGELTLGEALYDQVMAQRKHRRIRAWVLWGAAASVALLFLIRLLPHAEVADDVNTFATITEAPVPPIAEPIVREDMPLIAEAKPAPPIYPPIHNHIVKVAAEPFLAPAETEEQMEVTEDEMSAAPMPIVQEMAKADPKPIDIEALMQQCSAEMTEMEQAYREWKLEQSILRDELEIDITMKVLDVQCESYQHQKKANINI